MVAISVSMWVVERYILIFQTTICLPEIAQQPSLINRDKTWTWSNRLTVIMISNPPNVLSTLGFKMSSQQQIECTYCHRTFHDLRLQDFSKARAKLFLQRTSNSCVKKKLWPGYGIAISHWRKFVISFLFLNVFCLARLHFFWYLHWWINHARVSCLQLNMKIKLNLNH